MKAFNIWVTKKCNLKCSYCYEGIEKENRELAVDKIPAVIEFIQQMGKSEEYITVNFHGGEPLLNTKVIFEICRQLKVWDKMIYYSLTTNGILLEKPILEQLKKYCISLSISLDGIEEYHNKNRVDALQRGSYEKSIKGALLALEMGMDVRVRMTITPNNYAGMVEGVKHLIACGFKTIVAAPDFFSPEWTEKNIEDIRQQMILLEEYEEKFSFLEKQISRMGICSGGENECNIDVDLTIYPCTYSVGKAGYQIGTVTNGINMEKRAQIEMIGKEPNPACSGCSFEPYCMTSRCKIVNKILTGDCCEPSPVICAFERLAYMAYHKIYHIK